MTDDHYYQPLDFADVKSDREVLAVGMVCSLYEGSEITPWFLLSGQCIA